MRGKVTMPMALAASVLGAIGSTRLALTQDNCEPNNSGEPCGSIAGGQAQNQTVGPVKDADRKRPPKPFTPDTAFHLITITDTGTTPLSFVEWWKVSLCFSPGPHGLQGCAGREVGR